MMEKIIRRIVFFIVSTGILYFLWYGIGSLYNNRKTDTSFFFVVENLITPNRDNDNDTTLKEIIDGVSKNSDATLGIVVKHLKTGEQASLNPNIEFASASLYKLWVMATVYDAIEQGTLSEDSTLSQDISILNQEFSIPTESAELTEGTITETVAGALERMITVSDNYSALLLSEKIGNSTITRYLKNHGLLFSSLGVPPTTTAGDIALFFEKLYTGQLASGPYSQKMLELLKRQQLNKKLPKYLPKNIDIAHKTGELGTISHDAGIVFSPYGDYIIVVLTDSEKPLDANETIASISASIYTYMKNAK